MALQKLLDLEPERMIGWVWILRRAHKNQHEGLAFVNHVQIGIALQTSAKVFHFFFERRFPVLILEQNIVVDAAKQGNQLEPDSERRPCGI